MKLYVHSKKTNRKMYLSVVARNRSHLQIVIGSRYFTLTDGCTYDVNEVLAEKSFNHTMIGAGAGGLTSLIAANHFTLQRS